MWIEVGSNIQTFTWKHFTSGVNFETVASSHRIICGGFYVLHIRSLRPVGQGDVHRSH